MPDCAVAEFYLRAATAPRSHDVALKDRVAGFQSPVALVDTADHDFAIDRLDPTDRVSSGGARRREQRIGYDRTFAPQLGKLRGNGSIRRSRRCPQRFRHGYSLTGPKISRNPINR